MKTLADYLAETPIDLKRHTYKMSEGRDNDSVNHPSHYQSSNGVECIDAIEAATEDLKGLEAVCIANAIKYLWRWKDKEQIKSLKKAIWYIEKLITTLEKK